MPDLLLIGGIGKGDLAQLQAAFTVHRWEDGDYPADKITHVATNGGIGISPETMAELPNLQVISSNGVGYDSIDTTEAQRRNIIITHTPGVLDAEVATTAIMLMMACYRELLRDDAWVRSGDWASQGTAPLTRSMEWQSVGILGLGRIGQEIARKLAPWNATIVYHSRTQKDVPYHYFSDLTEMARDVDVLICTTPGGPETHHLVNRPVIEALGPQGTLVNVSRGSVVDETALINALSTGALGWAGLDVFEDEPHVPQSLRDMRNVVLLPHAASATVETRAAMGKLVVDNLLRHLEDGTVLTAVPECAGL